MELYLVEEISYNAAAIGPRKAVQLRRENVGDEGRQRALACDRLEM